MTARLLFLVLLSVLPGFTVQAQSVDSPMKERITGLEIEEHFNYIEQLYTGDNPNMQAIRAFVESYPTDDFSLTETISTNRDPGETHRFTKDKAAFIAQETQSAYELFYTDISHTLTDIRYLDDKTSAEVSYTALFQGRMKKELDMEGLSYVDFKSLSVCTNILKLVDGRIKGQKADCSIDVIYGDPMPVTGAPNGAP